MSLSDSYQHDPKAWAHAHFGDLSLGDVRRERRVEGLAQALAAQPGRSIPKLFARPYDVKATYQLLNHERLTPDALQSTHRRQVLEHLHQPGTYLLLEDATVFSWSGNDPIPGLGPIGTGKAGLQGFTLQSVLALEVPATLPPTGRRPAVRLLGLAHQQFHVRQPASPKESQLWLTSNEVLGPAPAQAHWIRVCDRGADIYEFLQSCQALNQDFVVRASKNRRVLEPNQSTAYLFETLEVAPALGTFELPLRARKGQPLRVATLSVSARPLCLRAPQRPGAAAGKLPPIECLAVRVWEADPPDGVTPLEWVLLCDAALTTFEAVLERVSYYATRWVIEEFHKALKSGMAAEKLQLETAERLFAAIAIWSVAALRLLELRELARLTPEAPASASGLDALELKILAAKLQRKLVTVRDVSLAIGRLGGHMNRKGDGLPGWQTLLSGMEELRLLTEGARLAMQLFTTFRE